MEMTVELRSRLHMIDQAITDLGNEIRILKIKIQQITPVVNELKLDQGNKNYNGMDDYI